jgi:hypothetical protein
VIDAHALRCDGCAEGGPRFEAKRDKLEDDDKRALEDLGDEDEDEEDDVDDE